MESSDHVGRMSNIPATITEHISRAKAWAEHRVVSDSGSSVCLLCGVRVPDRTLFGDKCEGRNTQTEQRDTVVVQGRLRDMLKAKAAQRREEQGSEAISSISCKVGAAMLMHGLVTSQGTGQEPGEPPKWAEKVHLSHNAWYAAGLVFCKGCGFIAAGEREGLRIFTPCRRATEGVRVPGGSQYRLDRAKRASSGHYGRVLA